jgi:hypothetical protein
VTERMIAMSSIVFATFGKYEPTSMPSTDVLIGSASPMFGEPFFFGAHVSNCVAPPAM